jgi:hypothetical protein
VDRALDALTFETPAELAEAIRAVIAPVHNRTWPSGLAVNQPGGVM